MVSSSEDDILCLISLPIFYALNATIVEVDGAYHNDLQQKEYDRGRTYELERLNMRVVRFTNEEVLTDMNFVLKEILKHLKIVH